MIFVSVSQAISFLQWFMQGCDCNWCTFSLRGRGAGVRQISSLEAYRLMLPPRPHPPPLRWDLIKDRLNFSLFVNLGIFPVACSLDCKSSVQIFLEACPVAALCKKENSPPSFRLTQNFAHSLLLSQYFLFKKTESN